MSAPHSRRIGQALAPHGLAFLADRLALARRQRAQEVIEAFVAVVAPVILLAEALQPAARAEALPVVSVQKVACTELMLLSPAILASMSISASRTPSA
jgi:hypothetical protein